MAVSLTSAKPDLMAEAVDGWLHNPDRPTGHVLDQLTEVLSLCRVVDPAMAQSLVALMAAHAEGKTGEFRDMVRHGLPRLDLQLPFSSASDRHPSLAYARDVSAALAAVGCDVPAEVIHRDWCESSAIEAMVWAGRRRRFDRSRVQVGPGPQPPHFVLRAVEVNQDCDGGRGSL